MSDMIKWFKKLFFRKHLYLSVIEEQRERIDCLERNIVECQEAIAKAAALTTIIANIQCDLVEMISGAKSKSSLDKTKDKTKVKDLIIIPHDDDFIN
jgi:hypothetical protein